MNFDLSQHWALLRPLFLIVLVAAVFALAWLVGWNKEWRDIERAREARHGVAANPEQFQAH
jgi:hypothetical protein